MLKSYSLDESGLLLIAYCLMAIMPPASLSLHLLLMYLILFALTVTFLYLP